MESEPELGLGDQPCSLERVHFKPSKVASALPARAHLCWWQGPKMVKLVLEPESISCSFSGTAGKLTCFSVP